MSKEKELAKNTIILTVGKICTQFISFLLLPLYTTLLAPKEYGIVDLFNTYITLLVPMFNWQFENGLFRFMIDVRADHKAQKHLFSTVFTANIVQSMLYLCFYLCANTYIVSEYKFFLAIDVILNIFLNTLLQFPRGLGKNKDYAVGCFVSAVSTVVFNVVFIAGFKMGAYGMFWATVVSKVLTIIYLVVSQKIWSYYSVKMCKISLFKEISAYSVPLIPNQLSWWIIGVSDRTIISQVISVAANGIYTVANKFPSIFITFYNIFNLSWTESVAKYLDDDDGEEFLMGTIDAMFRLFSCVCLGMLSCIPFVFPWFVNKQYSDAYEQIPILMLAVLFQVLVGLYSVIYVALKETKEIAKTSAMAAVINLVVNILLINKIGLYAASISTMISYAVLAVYRYFHVKKFVNIPLRTGVVIGTLVCAIIVTLSYYYNNMIINLLTLFVMIVYSFVMNKDFLVSVKDMIVKKIGMYK